jgi:hypothetical protein
MFHSLIRTQHESHKMTFLIRLIFLENQSQTFYLHLSKPVNAKQLNLKNINYQSLQSGFE